MTGIRQLADHLKISIGTVSRALNGKPDVNPDTRKRVLDAAEKLGYVANQSGRALRKGETGVIGFMMQTGPEITGRGDTFFMSVFDGVQTVLARHSLDLVAMLCSSEEDPDEYLKRMVARGFADGVILSATRRQEARFEYLARRKIPFITLGRSLTDVDQPWIDLDFEGMAERSVRRMVERGKRDLAFVWPHGDLNLGYVYIERCRQVLAEYGLDLPDAQIYHAAASEKGGYDVASQILSSDKRPDGVLLVSESVALGLYRGLAEVGLSPGRDIAVIGMRSPQAEFLAPSLTYFDLSLRDLGAALAESLLAAMPGYREHYPDAPQRQLWPMTFVEGESG
ncbi:MULTISPECIES: LacI family DNA-binding transcriptional regulator [unclassified Rhizobium]|uniref:LacI family DNA-binding transcriptional regulator n=1 Tax=unclassified Rhizobium TaxID=2613769 RepID=UPI0015FFC42C|nr:MULTISPECIES: LacI family DNA-binding transcriptional regulator [unclassified Rhizobium]MBB1251327.1 LacI family DNA-binding transcriptional regulator [Rhizobium sp. G21]MCV3767927.1 LacI family DNA-binding transcriptional regulator [Rhizobium sp. TRM95796]